MEKETKDIELHEEEDGAIIPEHNDYEWDEDLYGEDLEDVISDGFFDKEIIGKDSDEDLQTAYRNYDKDYNELVSILSSIIEKGELTEEDKTSLGAINADYDDSYTVIKQEIKNAQTISLENQLNEIKSEMLTGSQEDVYNALTNGGLAQGIYLGEDGEIYINAQFLQTRGLTVVNNDDEVTLRIDDDGNLTTSGDIVGGTITGAIMNAMTINTDTVNITSEDGAMTLEGAMQKFSDENGNIRIKIGKDTDGTFKFILYGEDGESVLIDKNGIKANAISMGTINVSHLNADVFNAVDAKIHTATIDKATIGQLNATNAIINTLQTNKADITELNAVKGNITQLESEVGKINTLESNIANISELLAGNITAENIQTGTITAGSGIIADGAIGSAQISELDASKIKAGKIDTSKVEVAGANNHLKIKGNRLQVFQGTGSNAKERVSLGDVNGDGTIYGLRVRGADGKTVLLDENGVKAEGITDGSITNNKISEDANIDGAKLNINSVVSKLNEDGTEVIKGNKIEVDGDSLTTKLSTITNKQTEDGKKITQAQSQITANANAIKLKVDNQTYQTDKSDMTSKLNKNTSEISAMKGQIALKVEQTDIDNAKSELEGSINSKINTAKSEIKVTTDAISQNVSNLSQTVSNKADGSTVTAINNKVSSLETNVNGISGRVTNVEKTTTTLNTQVDTAQSTADSAMSKANSAQSTANTNKGNITKLQGDVSTIKTDVAELEVTTTGISQKVSSVESTTASLTTQVGNAQNTANSANTNATNAMNKANSANSLADSKAKVFTTTPTVPYKIGDLWVQGATGEMMRCKTARSTGNYNSSDWEKASKYTDDTKANAVDGKVTTLQGEYNTTKSKVATLETTLDGITQRVSSTESTTTTLTEKIDVTVKNVTVYYAINTSSTTAPTSGWSTTPPTWVEGKYIWSKTTTTLTNGTSTTTNPVCITGAKGATGATGAKGDKGDTGSTGTGVESITTEYYLSTSKTTQTGGSWVTTQPTWTKGKYLWTRSKIVYKNPTSTAYTSPICDSSWDVVNDVQTQVDANKTQISTTSNKVSTIETNLSNITSRVNTVETTTKTLNDKVVSHESRLNTAEQKITDKAIINTVSSTITEKVNQGVEETEKLLNGNMDSAISSAKEDILDNISQNYATSNTVSELQKFVSSNMKQTSEDITMQFKTATDYTKEVDGKLEEYKKLVSTNIRFSEEGIDLGKTNSPFTATLDNTKLAFKQSGEEVAYISNNKMHITQAEVQENLRIGDKGTGFFSWSLGSNGNLSLKWSEN